MSKLPRKKTVLVKFFTTQIFFLFLAVSINAASAAVVSLKNKGTITSDNGRIVTQILITCSSATAEPRHIVSVPNERRWCSQDVPDVCGRTKISVASKVCKSNFESQIADYRKSKGLPEVVDTVVEDAPAVVETPVEVEEPVISAPDVVEAPVVPSAAVVDPQILIEEEKVRIEQEKLELRRKELELNKRRLELELQSN